MLHWANKDQYYTKSGESFSNYAFTLENGKKVQFRLVEADTAKDNRKDNDQARVFALIEPRIKTETDENGDEIQTDILPFDIQGDLLTLRFEYIAIQGTEKQRTKLQKEYILQAVEKIKTFAISDDFQEIFTLKPTDTNKTRTLLEKYLTDYTAKNTADYFIHKNLGKFLNQELDFYIKNEVMNLDNIQDSTDFSHIEQNLQTIKTIKTIKTVAKEIIAFLAQLEDFQKKLWLKKKFVAGCHYLITLDHLTEAQVQAALENPKQTTQWQALFNVNTSGLNAAELCKNYPHLVVDTTLFEPKFQADVLSNLHDLDEKTNGLLIHSDNFQALNLLQERYKEQVKCIYIDPPYNTNASEIIYKNGYKHSSWLSLIHSRLELCHKLQSNNGIISVAIDDYEVTKLVECMNTIYGQDNQLGIVAVRINPKGRMTTRKVSLVHEYSIFYGKSELSIIQKLPENPEDKTHNYKKDENGEWYLPVNLRKQGVDSDAKKSDGSYYDRFYPIYFCPKTKKVSTKEILDIQILPIDNSGQERIWRRSKDVIDDMFNSGDIWVNETSNGYQVYFKFKGGLSGKMVQSIWYDSKYSASDYGTKILDNTIGVRELFSYPKSPFTVIDNIRSISSENTGIVLDFFAGSGTTAHAVINLNREDNGNRKYILVEQGEYFDSVLKPRVQKVIFAKEWKDGKPQADNGEFGGVSQIVKVLKLESYEDTLNNLELKQPASDLFAQHEALQNDYLLHYMLDVESRDSLLNTQHFTKPFDYQLNIATTSAGVYEAKTIDLVETFNYLIGLRVSEINDKRENGLVMVQGINTSGEKTLVIWRDCEKYDYDKLNRYLDSRDINPQDSEFEVVYINGDHNVPTVFTDSDDSVKMLKVRSIEAEFLSKMFG